MHAHILNIEFICIKVENNLTEKSRFKFSWTTLIKMWIFLFCDIVSGISVHLTISLANWSIKTKSSITYFKPLALKSQQGFNAEKSYWAYFSCSQKERVMKSYKLYPFLVNKQYLKAWFYIIPNTFCFLTLNCFALDDK